MEAESEMSTPVMSNFFLVGHRQNLTAQADQMINNVNQQQILS